MIETGIVDLLNANTALTALIHSSIYRVLVPQDATYPCLSLHVVSADEDYTFDGRSLSTKRIQFDCWGETAYDAANTRAAVRTVLNTYSGTLSDGSVVRGAFKGNEVDFFEADSYKFRAVIEFSFEYTEP